MNLIKLDIYTNDFGAEKVANVLELKGSTATEIENETIESVQGKYIVRTKNEEKVVTAYYADNEENRKTVSELKVLYMMLKSKEMYGDFGWDVTLGRLYAHDYTVDEANWNEL
jgi:ribosomal protein L11 methylase PrmA